LDERYNVLLLIGHDDHPPVAMHPLDGQGVFETTDIPVVSDLEFGKTGEIDLAVAEKGA